MGSLVEVRLWTGRLHQIRAHLTAEGHPLVSDRAYGGDTPSWCPRIFLHCHRLSFPSEPSLNRNEDAEVRCPLPRDLREALQNLVPAQTGQQRAAQQLLRKWAQGGWKS